MSPSHYENGSCSNCKRENLPVRMYGTLVKLPEGGYGFGDRWLCDSCAPRLELIPQVKLIKGRLYKILCRNLKTGIYDGNGGFIGIREKLGSCYLFTEYHFDHGHIGTVRGMEDTGIQLPDGIPLETRLGSEDQITKRPVAFDRPVAEGGKGWFFTDTGEASEAIWPCAVGNMELFKFLKDHEAGGEGEK